MQHAFDGCQESHNQEFADCSRVYAIQDKVKAAIGRLPPEKQEEQSTKLDDYMATYRDYLGHILRTKHQADYYR